MEIMNINEFTRHIERVHEAYRCNDAICDLLKCDIIEYGDDLMASIIELLEAHFNDQSEWISYWMWELNFGEKYEEGTVISNGENIPLKSIEDLYKLLVDNIKAGDNNAPMC